MRKGKRKGGRDKAVCAATNLPSHSYPLGTDISLSSFDLHLVELPTNVNSINKTVSTSLDLGSGLVERKTSFPCVDKFFEIQSVFHVDSMSSDSFFVVELKWNNVDSTCFCPVGNH